MSFDSGLLSRALERKAQNRSRLEAIYEKRRERVFAEIPELAKNDLRMRRSAAEAVLSVLKNKEDPLNATAVLRDENIELQAIEVDLLVQHGYRPDYLHSKPDCSICTDTGYDGSAVCSCVRKIYAQFQTQQLDKKLSFEEHNFGAFDLSLYSRAEDKKRGISPRENMENILEYCTEYARSFGPRSSNLAFFGETGLGKTFLSACIAQVVSQNGHFVVYAGAGEIFSDYEAEKFSRSREAIPDASRYTECSLLILDDLGTEMITQFTVSDLYNVLNARLMEGKKTILSSNFTIKDLRNSYTPQIISRLEGEFRNFTFFGDDIRVKRRERY